MPPTDKYPEYPDGRIYFTKNARDPKVLNFAVDQVNGKARGNLKWTDGEGGNPAGRPAGAKTRISIKNVCDSMNTNPAELLVAIVSSDIGTLRKFGIKNPKEITLAQKLSTARYLTDKLVPNLKPVEVSESGDWEPNKIEGDQEESKYQIHVFTPGLEEQAKKDPEVQAKGIEKYLDVHKSEYHEEDEPDALIIFPNEES